MQFLYEVKSTFVDATSSLYQQTIDPESILVNVTKKEFNGDYTIVLFPYLKLLRDKPESIGLKVGEYMVQNNPFIKSTNVIKGFLNIELEDSFWINTLKEISEHKNFGHSTKRGEKVMVEFSSPNTNKPLHLGHIRNILLGWSCSKILEANGYDVVKVQIINDRGIAICKSMLAWEKFGQQANPTETGIKGDHFVGKYYVKFEKEFQLEYKNWQSSDIASTLYNKEKREEESRDAFFKRYKNNYFNNYSTLGKEAKQMLLLWEDGDEATKKLWKQMNGWVYDGFDVTYNSLDVTFDKLYYESDTYILGKEIVKKGLEKGIFYQKDDSSVWIDLSDVGMDQKIVLRSDGTSVYMTQDIGTAMARYEDFGVDQMVYTVADEQDYHFKVLFEILKRFEEPYADGLHHLSYGMVDLTTGKMKSREGTVVDADDLIKDVIEEASLATKERGELEEITDEERNEICRRIGMAALKFFIIKVNPKKRMTFDPKESLDMQGQTGPYVQNAFVRIQSVLRKYQQDSENSDYSNYHSLKEEELELLKLLVDYPNKIKEAGEGFDPSTIANYCYALAKEYHRFYHGVRILKAESEEAKSFRINLSKLVAVILKDAMHLLGIEMPSRM